MSKTFLVIKREYTKIITKPTFWFLTLAFPVLFGIVGFLSSYSATASKNLLDQQAKQANKILVLDQAHVINPQLLKKPFEIINNKDEGINEIKNNTATALFIYPADIVKTKSIIIYSQNKGLFSNTQYNSLASNLIEQGILAQINNPNKTLLVNTSYNISNYINKNGNIALNNFNDLIVPGIFVVIYFLFVVMSSSFLLLSLAEEKENRIMETILTIVTPKDLIWGKILGQVLVVISQMAIILASAFLIYSKTHASLPIDLSKATVNPQQIILGFVYVLSGFLVISCAMVGVSAVTPTYKEASSFSSIFILLSILPIYIISIILTDPNGTIATAASYIPLSSPIVLLARNALNALPPAEIIISVIVSLAYVLIFFYLSFKLFMIGSLEYSQRLSFKQVFKVFRRE